MSQPPGPQFGSPTSVPGGPGGPPPKQGGGALKIVLIVGGILLVFVLVCCGGCFVCASFGVGELGKQVKASYGNDPDVVDNIGADAEFSFDFGQSMTENEGRAPDDQVLAFTVKGSEGTGVITVKQDPGGGFSNGVLRTSDGTEFQLD